MYQVYSQIQRKFANINIKTTTKNNHKESYKEYLSISF